MTEHQFNVLTFSLLCINVSVIAVGLGIMWTCMMQGTRICRELRAIRDADPIEPAKNPNNEYLANLKLKMENFEPECDNDEILRGYLLDIVNHLTKE